MSVVRQLSTPARRRGDRADVRGGGRFLADPRLEVEYLPRQVEAREHVRRTVGSCLVRGIGELKMQMGRTGAARVAHPAQGLAPVDRLAPPDGDAAGLHVSVRGEPI